jgi:hypothetical protein
VVDELVVTEDASDDVAEIEDEDDEDEDEDEDVDEESEEIVV